jgi:hypothetical protein
LAVGSCSTNIAGALYLGISGSSRKKQRRIKRGQKMRCPKAPLGARIFVEKKPIRPGTGAAHRNINPALLNLLVKRNNGQRL